LWRLTFLNTIVVFIATAISGWAIYNTACFLAAGVGDFNAQRQEQYNSTLLNYLWIFMIIAAIAGSIFHYFLIKRLIKPIRQLIHSTKQMKLGHFPKPIEVYKQDEIGQLVIQYNELLDQLHENERHRKKLVSDLSHEIRTPISNLNGYLLGLKDGDITGDKELYASLYQESKRLSQMIEQLEQLKEWDNLSAQSLTNKEEIEIGGLLKQCVAMFKWTLSQKNITVQVDAVPCNTFIHIEGIQQVISNLLDNAILYYEGEGPIFIKGEKRDENYLISITGPSKPIPDQEKENIFKRFYRLDSSRSRETGGSGLGLAITKKIVEKHHQGEIGVKMGSNSNTFWFLLPVDEETD